MTTEPRTLQIVPDALSEPLPTSGPNTLARAVRQEGPLGEQARSLVNRVGGLRALEELDVEPLPDEPFDWAAVDDADRERVGVLLGLVDAVCDQWLDVEYRTIARRLLALVAARDPGPLRRSKRPARLAAGLVLAVLESNGAINRSAWRAKDVAAWFGISSGIDSARSLVHSARLPIPYPPHHPWGWSTASVLSSTALLHSQFRRDLLVERDRLIPAVEEAERRRAERRVMVAVDDGRTQRACSLADLGVVAKGRATTGQELVVVGFWPVQPQAEAELFALSASDAWHLRHLLDEALSEEAPSRWRPSRESWDDDW